MATPERRYKSITYRMILKKAYFSGDYYELTEYENGVMTRVVSSTWPFDQFQFHAQAIEDRINEAVSTFAEKNNINMKELK